MAILGTMSESWKFWGVPTKQPLNQPRFRKYYECDVANDTAEDNERLLLFLEFERTNSTP